MQPRITVSQFVEIMNQVLVSTLPSVDVTGEVSGFKIWQGRLAFFALKDQGAAVDCMVPVGSLKTPIEDGMQVVVNAACKLTRKGRFSLEVRQIDPLGEGALQRAFALLKLKLESEGLFEQERKRPLPSFPQTIAVVTSLESAAYRDFLKAIRQRWGGLDIMAVNTQVQGEAAPEQLVAAIAKVNQLAQPPDVLVVTRGGGSIEDLAAFNSEAVVRAVSSSRVPTVVAVGHETDSSLADLAADCRAMTPTDAACQVVPDRTQIQGLIDQYRRSLGVSMNNLLLGNRTGLFNHLERFSRSLSHAIPHAEPERLRVALTTACDRLLVEQNQYAGSLKRTLKGFNPQAVLDRGYAVVRHRQQVVREAGRISTGDLIVVQLAKGQLTAEVKDVKTDRF